MIPFLTVPTRLQFHPESIKEALRVIRFETVTDCGLGRRQLWLDRTLGSAESEDDGLGRKSDPN